jgi:hypothetical protein
MTGHGHAQYPHTVAECLDPEFKYKREALAAAVAFAQSGPWQGTREERKAKFMTLHAALCAAYGMRTPLHVRWSEGSSGGSHFIPSQDSITLTGRPSVVTYLHEFGHARGYDEYGAVIWSVNLFKKCFPEQFARCSQVGHMLVPPPRRRRNPEGGDMIPDLVRYGPGKFRNSVDEWAYQRTLDGTDSEIGDVSVYGFWAGIIRMDADQTARLQELGIGPAVAAVVHEDDQGFVNVFWFDTEAEAAKEFEKLAKSIEEMEAQAEG